MLTHIMQENIMAFNRAEEFRASRPSTVHRLLLRRRTSLESE
jgi:hypothetical protein